jgi:hypothetical protein
MATPLPEDQPTWDLSPDELEHARLDGVRLAARTLEYHLTNSLTLTIGYAELLAEDPELAERLQDMAHQVLENAQRCVEVVRQLRCVDALRLSDQRLPDGPLLDLDTTR